MDNKDRFISWLKVAIILLWASIAIGTTFAVWNAGAGKTPDTLIKWVAAFNLLTNGFGIWLAVKKYKPLDD